MKALMTFVVLAAFTCMGQAQNKTIDSLKTRIIKAKSDTARINLTNDMIVKLSEVNLDSSIALGKNVLQESRKLGYNKGEANALINMSSILLKKSDFDSAKQYLNDAKMIVLRLKDSMIISTLYGTQGMMYGMQGKYDSSMVYFKNAIAIAESMHYTQNLGRYYGGLAIGYQMQSNYPEALRYQQKSLQLAEDQNNISSQAYTLLNMGNTYQKISDTLRAEKTLLKAVDLAKKAGVKNVEIYSYSNLASLYQDMKKWEADYKYAIKAALLADEMGDGAIEAASYSKAAISLSNLKRYGEAITLIKKGMAVPEATIQPIINSQLNEAMARTLMLQEKYGEAIPYFEKCLEVSKETDLYDPNVAAINLELAKCYENTGAYKKALSSFKEYATIKDSITSKENIQQATEQTMTYEFEKKEQAQRIEQEKRDSVARVRQWALIIGLGLTLILVFVAYRAFHIKKKANAKLKVQKEEVQNTLSQLKTTQSQLIQSEKMASLGELTAGIAHEIQNPLNFVNNFSEVNNEIIAELQEERSKKSTDRDEELENELLADIKQNLEKITHHGKRADAIVKGMLQHSRKNTAEKEPADINALCDEYLRLAYHGLRAKDKSFNATLQTDFDDSIGKINVIPQDLGRVVLNLITNAFYAVNEKKSAFAKAEKNDYQPTVSVSTKKEKGRIGISVKDNGNGIPKEVLDKIYQPFFTTKPTGQGTGLGLSLSYDIVKAHGGELKVATEEGVGTVFSIELPLI
jgi:signal transduction histidine kinase